MSDDHVNPPRVLFLALADYVGMDRLPAAMAKVGAVCALISPPGFYSSKTRFIERHFALFRHYGIWLGTAFARGRLETAVRIWHPDIVIPLDDVASNLLRGLTLSGPLTDRLRHLINTSLGAPAGYAAPSSRAELMRVAFALGIRVPRFHVADDTGATLRAAADWGYPVVLKAEHTCGGSGVVIAPDAHTLCAALTAPSGFAAMWRRCRLAGRDWMWTLAGLAQDQGTAPVMQALIRGVPAMRTVSAWKGRVLTGVSFVAEHVHPAPFGASSMVRHIEHPEMEAAVLRLVEALGCSGIVSFDFMLDEEHGAAHLIEMNPRPIGTTHLGWLFGHDVAAALLSQLQGKPVPAAAANNQPDRLIALFPRELERDPFAFDRLRWGMILHDVPHDDPTVVAAYVRRLSHIHPRAAARIASSILPDSDHDAGGRHTHTLGGGVGPANLVDVAAHAARALGVALGALLAVAGDGSAVPAQRMSLSLLQPVQYTLDTAPTQRFGSNAQQPGAVPTINQTGIDTETTDDSVEPKKLMKNPPLQLENEGGASCSYYNGHNYCRR
jgi:hypothetical protein